MGDIQRSIRLTSQVNCTAYRFRFGKRRTGDVMVMGGQLSLFDALTAEEIQNFCELSVDIHSSGLYPEFLQNTEKSPVVYMAGA